MKEIDSFEYALMKGWTFNPETGEIRSHMGKVINSIQKDGYIYCAIHIDGKSYNFLSHRFIWYFFYKEIPDTIDHINRVRNDNRIENLRNVTNQQNQFNTNAKGYYWDKKANKYRARIAINGILKHLGYYDTTDEAHNVYLEAKKIYHIF